MICEKDICLTIHCPNTKIFLDDSKTKSLVKLAPTLAGIKELTIEHDSTVFIEFMLMFPECYKYGGFDLPNVSTDAICELAKFIGVGEKCIESFKEVVNILIRENTCEDD